MKHTKPLLLTTTIMASSFLLSACIPGLNKLTNRNTADQTENPPQQTTAQMMAALKTGQSMKCLVTGTEEAQNFEYYLKGEKFRMNGTTMVNGQAQATHAISDGSYMYTWSTEQGVKIKIPTAEELAEQADKYQDYVKNNPDLTDETVVKQYEDQGYTIKCDPTAVDDALFVPPTDVEFQDLSAMMESATKMMKDAPAGGQITPEQLDAYKKAMEKQPQ